MGTSASLYPERRNELARSAENLFGEPFLNGDGAVVTSERKQHALLTGDGATEALSPELWVKIGKAVEELCAQGSLTVDNADYRIEDWNAAMMAAGIPGLTLEGIAFGEALIERLAGRTEVRRTAQVLMGRSLPFEGLAQQIFCDVDPTLARHTLNAVIALGVLAKPSTPGDFPLLPARYRIAASGVEGIALSLTVVDAEHWFGAPIVSSAGLHADALPAYPLLVCGNCGEP